MSFSPVEGKRNIRPVLFTKKWEIALKINTLLKTWSIITASSDKISSNACTSQLYCGVNLLKRLYSEKWYSSLRVASCNYKIFPLVWAPPFLILPDAIFILPWRSIKYQQTQNSLSIFYNNHVKSSARHCLLLCSFMTLYNLFLIFVALLFIVFMFISTSCVPACIHLSIPKHFQSVHIRYKDERTGPFPPLRSDTTLHSPGSQLHPLDCPSGLIWLLGTLSCASLKALL